MIVRVLGSGPANPITNRKDKSNRLQSSILIDDSILVDPTPSIEKQIQDFSKIRHIVITHAHMDAIGGLPKLLKLDPLPEVYALPHTIKIIKERLPSTKKFHFNPLSPSKEIILDSIPITPILVEHSVTEKRFDPTASLKIGKMVYAEDLDQDFFLSNRSNELKKAIAKSYMTLLDGAMCRGKLPGHLNIFKVYKELKRINAKRIYFIQVGRSCPDHEKLLKIIRRINPNWSVCHDGMKIDFGSTFTEYLTQSDSGIYLDGSHARMIHQGNKSLIVSHLRMEQLVNRNHYLIGGNICYGIIRVKEMKQINLDQFKKLESKHRINEQERNNRWKGKRALFAYNFDVVKMFEAVRQVAVSDSTEFYMETVDFLLEEELSDVSFTLQQQAFGSSGGKSRVVDKLMKMVPEHKTYVEPFAGGAALFWKKEPAEKEVINDIDPEISFAYRFIKSATKEQIARLKKRKWDGDKVLFFRLKKSSPSDPVDKFYKFAYTHAHSYGLSRKTFGYKKQSPSLYKRIPVLQERLKKTTVRGSDYKDVVREFDSPDTFFFFDPPYPGEWAGPSGVNTWKEKDVDEFAQILKGIKGKFLVTINNLPWVRKKLAAFQLNTFTVPRTFRKGDVAKKELLVANYGIKKLSAHVPSFAGRFEDAVIMKDAVSVVGSSVEKKEHNDVDILIRLGNSSDFLLRAIRTRISKMIGEREKVHFIEGDSEGPHDSFVPVYDIVLKRIKPKVMKMSGISPMTPFNPMKPRKRFYNVGETIEYMFGGL